MPPKRRIGNGSSQTDTEHSKRRKLDERKKPTQAEKQELREWLDKREKDPKLACVFNVKSYPVTKPKKGKAYTGLVEQLSLGGHDHMAVAYSVTPQKEWNQLHVYKKFTLPNGETHEQGSCVFVKHSNSGDNFDFDKQWKAQVLEVRALDENHVYLRVAWLEIPRELPSGKKPYHAGNELVVSNEMYIIDAQTVNGGLEVVYWDETNDELPPPGPDNYFWRQQYDKSTNSLTRLREICKCEMPHNPNDMIVRCSSCTEWLHAPCIVEYAKARELASTSCASQVDGGSDNEVQMKQRKRRSGTATKQERQLAISISLAEDNKPRLLIEEKDTGHSRTEEVRCLLCDQVME